MAALMLIFFINAPINVYYKVMKAAEFLGIKLQILPLYFSLASFE